MKTNYSKDIQTLFIQGLISHADLFVRCQNILSSKYFDPTLQPIVKFIVEYVDEYKSIPTTDQIFAHTGHDIPKLQEALTVEHEQYFMDQLESFCRHKALEHAIIKSSELVGDQDFGQIEKLIKDAMLVGLHKNLGTEYFEDPLARLRKLKEENGTIKTNWLAVDQKLYNVGRGELLIFVGNTGGGKSVCLQNVAINFALQGLHCVYVTLELSEELCAKRMDSMITGIAMSDVFKRLDDVNLMVQTAGKNAGRINIKKFSANVTSERDIRSYLKEYQVQTGCRPDVLLVDYLDLLGPNNKKISPSDLFVKDKYISEELRNLAGENQLLCVSASQFNRSATDAIDFDHSQIAGGISKSYTADNVIGIHLTPAMRERGEVSFQFLKTRNAGSTGQKVNLSYDQHTLRIDNAAEASISTNQNKSVIDQIKNRNNLGTSSSDSTGTSSDSAADKAAKLRNLINKTKGY